MAEYYDALSDAEIVSEEGSESDAGSDFELVPEQAAATQGGAAQASTAQASTSMDTGQGGGNGAGDDGGGGGSEAEAVAGEEQQDEGWAPPPGEVWGPDAAGNHIGGGLAFVLADEVDDFFTDSDFESGDEEEDETDEDDDVELQDAELEFDSEEVDEEEVGEEGEGEEEWSDVASQSSGSSGVDVGADPNAVVCFVEEEEDARDKAASTQQRGGQEQGGMPPTPPCSTRRGSLPICTSYHHQQTADSLVLSTAGLPGNAPPELLVYNSPNVLQGGCVELWSVAGGSAGALSGEAVCMARAVCPIRPYSLSQSGSGHVVATGGERGYLMMYHLRRSWQQREGEQQRQQRAESGSSAGPSSSQAAGPAGGDGEAAGSGAGQGSAALSCAFMLRVQQNPLTNYSNMCNGIRFGRVGDRERMLVAEQDGYVTIMELPPPPAANPVQGFVPTTISESAAAYAAAAAQAMPAAAAYGAAASTASAPPPVSGPRSLCCSQLTGAEGCEGEVARITRMVEVRPVLARPAAAAMQVVGPLQRIHTAAIGPWPCAVNSAVPSPDGEWIAVVGDALKVWLLPRSGCYRYEARRTLTVHRPELDPDGALRPESGCQYAAWSSCGTRLAATSDAAARCVLVWDVASGQQTHCIPTTRPCLPVSFAPWDATLLAFGQEAKYAHVAYLKGEGQYAMQQIRVPRSSGPGQEEQEEVELPHHPKRRIHGLAIDARSRRIFVATKDRVLHWQFVCDWTPQRHAKYPAAFKAAVRTLLLASTFGGGGAPHPSTGDPQFHPPSSEQGPEAHGLWSLPRDVVMTIIEMSSRPMGVWAMPAGPAAATSGL